MKHLLNLLAAIALLVWGTHMVRTGVLRVFGANLRDLLAHSMSNRFSAALSGLGVTALVQSSTATSLMTSAFVGQGLISLPAALAVMRGADVGTALMAVLFSTDLSWLSPLFIFVGVRSEEHTSELQSPCNLVCRLLLEKKNTTFKLTTSRYITISTMRLTATPSLNTLSHVSILGCFCDTKPS